jgi:hypothetical protein
MLLNISDELILISNEYNYRLIESKNKITLYYSRMIFAHLKSINKMVKIHCKYSKILTVYRKLVKNMETINGAS